MKTKLLIPFFLLPVLSFAQEVLRVKPGATITVQPGASLYLQGGITLENGSLLINNGTTVLRNNAAANQSDWKDQSFIGALGGNGLVIFNSDLLHQYWGPTHFYNLQINTGGLTLNNDLQVENQLHLVKGKVNTGSQKVFLSNNLSSALVNDATNTGYAYSWINGNFRRQIGVNTDSYDFPVGNSVRANLLQFLNNNLSGADFLDASFGPKPGTDAGLNVTETGLIYTGVNNGGVWYLSPNAAPGGGNFALHVYFNGFTGLLSNQFGILRRPNASSDAADWSIPAGSAMEPANGLGRLVSDGFARRFNISDFSQFGIGMFQTCVVCTPACSYTQGFYSNPKGMACYYSSPSSAGSISSTDLMLNAFGANTYQVFGNIANLQFFTLLKSDISNGNIFKMLPGFGGSQALLVDNISPYTGATYSDKSTWYLVPVDQKGKLRNVLLSQLISLWFNIRTSPLISTIDLTNDTLVTMAQTFCGSGIPTGVPAKFGLPHDVIVYLNGGNGYTHDVSGLYNLANDVLGGVVTNVSPSNVQSALARINEAFDGCRILTATIPYSGELLPMTKIPDSRITNEGIGRLVAVAYPNPYEKHFSLRIHSPLSGMAAIEFYSSNGAKIHSQRNYLQANTETVIPYSGPIQPGSLFYKIRIGEYSATGFVISTN